MSFGNSNENLLILYYYFYNFSLALMENISVLFNLRKKYIKMESSDIAGLDIS